MVVCQIRPIQWKGIDHVMNSKWSIENAKDHKESGFNERKNSSPASPQAISLLPWHNKECIKGHWIKQAAMHQWQPHPSCVCAAAERGLIKSSEMCVMLSVSTRWQSTAQHSGPLNRALLLSASLSPPIPSLHSPPFLSAPPLPQATFFPFLLLFWPPHHSFKLLFLCAALTFPKHEVREVERPEEERMERRRRRWGKVSEKVRNWSAGHFLSHCCGWRDDESANREKWEIKRRLKVTEMEKLRSSERRDTSLSLQVQEVLICSSGANFISSHLHFLILPLSSLRVPFHIFCFSLCSFSHWDYCW